MRISHDQVPRPSGLTLTPSAELTLERPESVPVEELFLARCVDGVWVPEVVDKEEVGLTLYLRESEDRCGERGAWGWLLGLHKGG